jgi:hypothetical protein
MVHLARWRPTVGAGVATQNRHILNLTWTATNTAPPMGISHIFPIPLAVVFGPLKGRLAMTLSVLFAPPHGPNAGGLPKAISPLSPRVTGDMKAMGSAVELPA